MLEFNTVEKDGVKTPQKSYWMLSCLEDIGINWAVCTDLKKPETTKMYPVDTLNNNQSISSFTGRTKLSNSGVSVRITIDHQVNELFFEDNLGITKYSRN